MVQGFGVVVITHGSLGESLLDTCRMITGEMTGVSCVSVGSKDDVDLVRTRISTAIDKVKGPMGAILLVDMFGGTPSNIALSFLTGKDIEVVTGVNLPMLTKLFAFGPEIPLHEAAVLLRDYGREHIKVATEYLTGD